jgi:hypothetical protein
MDPLCKNVLVNLHIELEGRGDRVDFVELYYIGKKDLYGFGELFPRTLKEEIE